MSDGVVDSIVLPLIGFVIAVFGVFFDPKQNPRTKGSGLLILSLILALGLTAGLSGYSAWAKARQARTDAAAAAKYNTSLSNALDITNTQLKELQTQGQQLQAQDEQMSGQLSMLVVKFGLAPQNQTLAVLQRSLRANAALARLDTEATRATNSRITVEYFPKEVDQEVVEGALRTALTGAGFVLEPGKTQRPNTATNIVWYGANVPDASVRMVALALVRAGVQIRRLAPFKEVNIPAKSRLIQIGSDAVVEHEPPLTVDQINTTALLRH